MFIEVKNVTHIYNQDNAVKALDDINLVINEGEFIGLVGHTGSGKSTLVQLFNGLIKPTQGQVIIDGVDISDKKGNWKRIRQQIGLVFQYPEHQIFEESIYHDIAFGPRNLNLDENEIKKRVKDSLELMGLDFNKFKDRSPFNLSGGQQRKVAIAGVLAMKPEVLILDEPSAGLDPEGRKQLIDLLRFLHSDTGMTIILISHRMEEIANLADRVIVMNKGQIRLDNIPEKVFNDIEEIRNIGLDLPEITEILWCLKKRGLNINTNIFTVGEAVQEIAEKTGVTR
ncbi:MAG: energy-coupling factor transporter ATPase [Bacillota bacterium]